MGTLLRAWQGSKRIFRISAHGTDCLPERDTLLGSLTHPVQQKLCRPACNLAAGRLWSMRQSELAHTAALNR